MGYGFPAAIGTQIAHPNGLVIDVAGEASQHGTPALPAAPPPDIDLEAWKPSLDLIGAWGPEALFAATRADAEARLHTWYPQEISS